MCPFSRKILYWLLCSVPLVFNQDAGAQQTPLGKLLQANRYELSVQGGELSGSGAPFIKKALSKAEFVAIGEEHGTREVPQFVGAICRAMAPENLDAMAIEAGPLVTAQLEQWMAESGGTANLASFVKEYPDSIAFFNWKQEFDLLSQCQQANAPHALQLWGLDQEYLGSPTFILRQILESRPGPQAEAIVKRLQVQCAVGAQKSLVSGSWNDACMFQLSAADLSRLEFTLAHTGNLRAKDLTAALIKTQHIYSLHESGHRYEANRERALLLKHNFISDYQRLSKTNGRPPRILLKFGGNHLYKGFDETELNDLGNFLTEFADGLGSTSLHIEVLGMRGEDEVESGPGKPDRAVAKDTNPGPLAPFYAQAYSGAWTVFDLRPLRSQFADLGHVDRELERVIFGYDMLVLVPEVTPEVVIK
jgi:hypothetical protein